MKYIFAGDRQISCEILKFLMEQGYPPSALLVTEGLGSSHSNELVKISKLNDKFIFRGKEELKNEVTLQLFKDISPDYIFGIHYPYIIKSDVIRIPAIGFLNLHPSYLPYNKGWHTPSWAILEGTPYGATLHFMSEELDKGDIIHQRKLEVTAFDTANTLYQKVLNLEKEIFIEAFPGLLSLSPPREIQTLEGTSHLKKDLVNQQAFKLDDQVKVEDFLKKLRALSTNSSDEWAYFIDDGRKIGVKVEMKILD